MAVHHPSHPTHELQLKTHKKPYTCDGCKQPGVGSCYRCEQCDYDLHPDCAFPLSPSPHEFFPKSTFTFLKSPPKACCDHCSRYCDACGKPVHGFLYHSSADDLDLHPCCRSLRMAYANDGVVFTLQKKLQSKCDWCNEKYVGKKGFRGWSYVSGCGKFRFHVSCVTEMVLEEWGKEGDCAGNEGEPLALDRVNLKVIRRRGGRSGGQNKYWRIVKALWKTIACVVLGDPTITLTCLLVDLLT